MSDKIVTRFAPSPTGYLHIGGARTALFNWLYARHTGGVMRLRIEDTDRERSTEPAIAAIKSGLAWLGLDWNGDVVSQFSRADRHREVVEQLLAAGCAYRCYCTPQELEEMRAKAMAEHRPPRYDGRWRDRPASEAPSGVAPAIRFRAPDEGETIVADKVQGRVVIPNKDLDDLIILRSDGNPTYNLSVVVDDHDMGVTHIIRGVDHLTNAARQTQIYLAMGWEVPVMAHIPLIHGPDGAKLSKRHGALGVEAYRDMGYLPAAMRNYLVRLGWSHGDDEIMSDEQMSEWFDFDGIGKSAARFDFAKLENLNGHYIRTSSDTELVDAMAQLLPHLADRRGLPETLTEDGRTVLIKAMSGLKERARTLVELWDGARFLFSVRPLELDEKAAGLLTDEARSMLGDLHDVLLQTTDWDAAQLETQVKTFAESRGLKLGKVAQPLRAALTGRSTSPGIFDVLTVLGREESLGRLADQSNRKN